MAIYAWPPVGIVSAGVQEMFPVRRSRMAIGGQEIVSSAGPTRREIGLQVSALSMRDRSGAGYMQSLARLLRGGEHWALVPLPPANWHLDDNRNRASGLFTGPVEWTTGGEPLAWLAGALPLSWFAGPTISGTSVTVDGMPGARIEGLVPLSLVCRAFDLLRSYDDAGASQGVARAVRAVYADGAGVAEIPLFSALPAGTVSVGDIESAVFRLDIGGSQQGIGQNWQIAVTGREVLPAEYAGADVVNPWTADV